jgi:hypothetical protein
MVPMGKPRAQAKKAPQLCLNQEREQRDLGRVMW